MIRHPAFRAASLLLPAALLTVSLGACGGGDQQASTVTRTVKETAPSTATTEPDTRKTETGSDQAEGDAGPTLSLKGFVSPTGNISCALDSRSVRCDIREKTWKMPRPAGCDLDYGYGATVTSDAPRGEVLCAGDTLFGYSDRELPYGSNAAAGSLTCRSREAGITCINGGGHGFFLSRASYRLF